MKIIFFGSDEFAAVHLEHLFASRHTVAACVTQPDTRKGRGMAVALSPIKVLAEGKGIECLQPEGLKSPAVAVQLRSFDADIFVVVAYGKLLTQAILDIPKVFCVNVHGSLLPQYRGAAPINWAILNGDRVTGATVQKMALELDAGDIIAQTRIDILPEMTADVLKGSMAQQAAALLITTLDDIEKGRHSLTPQDPAHVSYAPKLNKDMGRIDWNDPADVICNQVRGLKPWPGAYTSCNGKMLKVLEAQAEQGKGAPGTVIAVDKKTFTVACGQGALVVLSVHPEAGKAMPARSFVDGYKITNGLIFS